MNDIAGLHARCPTPVHDTLGERDHSAVLIFSKLVDFCGQ
jgi:hypothetical protein